jgi:hypothetical protein
MSTIKSSAENLTLNADGANNDIKFQSNGTEVASIDQSGNLAVSGTVDGVDIQTLNSAVSANTAKVTNATHTGDVTGATALTIADNIIDEANLKVSNAPTNGYMLTAQSGNTGGLTWAAASGGGGGSLVFVSKTAISSDTASVTFTSLGTAYKHYYLTYYIKGSTTCRLGLELSEDNGSNFLSADTVIQKTESVNSAVTTAKTTGGLQYINGSTLGWHSGEFFITNAGVADGFHMREKGVHQGGSYGVVSDCSIVINSQSTAINCIKLSATYNNFASGTVFTLYGIKDS